MKSMNYVKTPVRWLTVAATVGMFVVLVMGATVTNTGSEHGCGRSWPLCHGQFLPQMAVSTMIEFSHRAVVGVESVLVIAAAVAVLLFYRRFAEMRLLAPVMVFFLFLQAGLGAWAVMQPQSDAALALHFGVSLLAFVSVLLTAVVLFEMTGGAALRNRPLPRGFRLGVWGITLYSYIVVYLGAYVRHANADEGCKGWPTCNGAVIPQLHGKVAANFIHRSAAGVLVLLILGLCIWAWRNREQRPDLFKGSALALFFVILQALAGALVAWTNMDLFSALLHAGLVALMFGSLAYLCLHVTRARLVDVEEEAPARHGRSMPEPAGLG